MSDHDITPDIDDEIRARLRAYATDVADTADADLALEHLPARGTRRRGTYLAVAAAVLVALALPVVLRDDHGVRTTDQADAPAPATTECPEAGGDMDRKLATRVAAAATAIVLVAACSDDGPTTIVSGTDIEFVGSDGLGQQSLDIEAVLEDDEVTGEARFTTVVVDLECHDPDAEDGTAVVGGLVTTPSGDNSPAVGEFIAVIVEDGDPDRAAIWIDSEPEGSCDEVLDSIPAEAFEDSAFAEVESGDLEVG